jgi:hypothetical protein
MYVGTNSDGDLNGLEDFVEIYAKTTFDLFGEPNVGTRLFITPGEAGGFGINVGNTKTWDTAGVSQCDMRFTSDGLHITGDIWLTGEVHDSGSHTIIHKTNIIGFKPEHIGCFCESTGELADIYGVDYIPTLDRATDAIMKVRHCKSFSPRIVGIITDYNQFANLGDMLCRVINDSEFSIHYEVGQLLYPDESGLCRIATHEEKLLCAIEQIRLPKITRTIPDSEFVGCFMV